MRDKKWHSQCLASLQFVDKTVDRAFAQFLIRGAKVEQIGVVRHDHFDSSFGTGFLECRDLLSRIWLGGPLTRAFGENLDTVTYDLAAPRGRLADAACDRHVCADQGPLSICSRSHR